MKAAAERLYDGLHEKRPYHDGSFQRWAEKPSEGYPFHYRDGITIVLLDHDANPGDKFTTDENADPRSVAEQTPGDEDESTD